MAKLEKEVKGTAKKAVKGKKTGGNKKGAGGRCQGREDGREAPEVVGP